MLPWTGGPPGLVHEPQTFGLLWSDFLSRLWGTSQGMCRDPVYLREAEVLQGRVHTSQHAQSSSGTHARRPLKSVTNTLFREGPSPPASGMSLVLSTYNQRGLVWIVQNQRKLTRNAEAMWGTRGLGVAASSLSRPLWSGATTSSLRFRRLKRGKSLDTIGPWRNSLSQIFRIHCHHPR